MATDNRTSEPTPEQVEAVAVASINSHRSRAGLPTLATLNDVPNADEWRDDARAALVAAQEAAPQDGYSEEWLSWCREETCVHRHWRSGGMPTHRRGDDCPTPGKHAPVLPSSKMFSVEECPNSEHPGMTTCGLCEFKPSSTLDEEKLAEVLSQHVLGAPNGGTSAWAWVNCSCGHRIEIAGVTREHVVALGRKHQARAVTEWLKGQGR